MLWIKSLAIWLILAHAAAAQVTLIDDLSLPASADGFNITYDETTGLEWLDLDLSAGRTVDDLTGVDGTDEFAPGGDFEGFRYATHLELTGAVNGPQLNSLYKSLDISPFGFSSIGGYDEARRIITIAGCFGSCSEYGYSYGALFKDGVESEASMEAFTSQGFDWGRSNPHSPPILFSPNDDFPLQKGNWLVRGLDTDSDGIADIVDNCTHEPNNDQLDTDGDGHGNVCDADFDNSCFTTFPDLAIMEASFFTNDPLTDLDASGLVTFPDLAIMESLFFLPPGPSAPGSLCNP